MARLLVAELREYAPYDVSGEGTDFEGLTRTPGSSLGEHPPGRTPAQRRERARLVAAAVIGAVVTAFALVNLGDVKVHWLIASGHTPLIVVIAIAFLLGMIADRLLIRRRRRRQ